MICISIHNGGHNTAGEAVTLLKADLRSTTLIWSVEFIANDRLDRAGVSVDINKSFEWITVTDSQFSSRVLV